MIALRMSVSVYAAPGHVTGRGLKQDVRDEASRFDPAAPGHVTGRGLKHPKTHALAA